LASSHAISSVESNRVRRAEARPGGQPSLSRQPPGRARVVTAPRRGRRSTPRRPGEPLGCLPVCGAVCRTRSSTSHEEARAVGDSRLNEGSRSSHASPRTREGPSDSTIRLRPILSIGQVLHWSLPLRSLTFSSSVSASSASAVRVPAPGSTVSVNVSWARRDRQPRAAACLSTRALVDTVVA
jgi:hypothetical protein